MICMLISQSTTIERLYGFGSVRDNIISGSVQASIFNHAVPYSTMLARKDNNVVQMCKNINPRVGLIALVL